LVTLVLFFPGDSMPLSDETGRAWSGIETFSLSEDLYPCNLTARQTSSRPAFANAFPPTEHSFPSRKKGGKSFPLSVTYVRVLLRARLLPSRAGMFGLQVRVPTKPPFFARRSFPFSLLFDVLFFSRAKIKTCVVKAPSGHEE